MSCQKDSMAFYYENDCDTILHYSELILFQDSTYSLTYFVLGGYNNFESGKFEILEEWIILHPNLINTSRKFVIVKNRKHRRCSYESKNNDFLGFHCCLIAEELNSDFYDPIHIGRNSEKLGSRFYWYKTESDRETFIRCFTDKEESKYWELLRK